MIFKLLIVFVLSSIPLSIKTETKIPIRQTCDEKKYNQNYTGYLDSREISNFNFFDKSLSFKKYTQVFETKYGFKENLSMLDLLFNYGPNYYNFLIK